MIAAIADLLPLALAAALSPFPVVAAVLVVGAPEGALAGVGFAIGWLAALGTLTLLLTFALGEAEGLAFSAGAWVQILIGLLLLAAAVKKWRSRPRGDDPVRVPAWMRPLEAAGPGRAAVFGALLGANPKNIALAAAAASSIAYAGLTGAPALAAAAIFVGLASLTVVGAVLARRLGGAGAAAGLESLKSFMLRNNSVIVMVVFLFLGVKILGDGLAALGA
jgi:threonine/homoserine/homoserine lactone efflux protein